MFQVMVHSIVNLCVKTGEIDIEEILQMNFNKDCISYNQKYIDAKIYLLN